MGTEGSPPRSGGPSTAATGHASSVSSRPEPESVTSGARVTCRSVMCRRRLPVLERARACAIKLWTGTVPTKEDNQSTETGRGCPASREVYCKARCHTWKKRRTNAKIYLFNWFAFTCYRKILFPWFPEIEFIRSGWLTWTIYINYIYLGWKSTLELPEHNNQDFSIHLYRQ